MWLLQCLKELKQKYLEKEDRYKNLASLDEMHTKLEELQKQMAWTLVSSFSPIFFLQLGISTRLWPFLPMKLG